LNGDLYKNSPVSLYQPDQAVADLTACAKKEFNYGWEILHRPYPELNDYSVIDRMNKDQRTFNSFVDESVEDPNEAWKWRGTRSMARNRAMAMHAHLTNTYFIDLQPTTAWRRAGLREPKSPCGCWLQIIEL
jgi:hypothetical protein